MTAAPRRGSEQRALDGAFLRGMGAVAVFVALASIARVAQDAAIAWRFGTGATVDAYYFLLNVAGWPVAVAVSMMGVLVAPADAQLRSIDAIAHRQFRSELLAATLVCAVIALPLAWLVMAALAGGGAGGLERAAATQAAAGAAGLAAMVPLGLVSAVLSAWLVASGRHVLALVEGIPSLLLLLLVLAIPRDVLFWGTSAGFVLQVLVMAWMLRRHGEWPAPRLGRSSLHWQSFSRGALLLLGAQALFSLVPLIDTFFAARLGPGTVSALSYTNRLVLGLQGLAGLALQRSGLPLLARLGVHSPAATHRTAWRWAAGMGALGAVGGALVAALADPIIALLFERGGFTAADRAQCATLLRYGMLQMPLFLAGMALVTGLASVHARRALALVAVINVLVKLAASFVLVPRLGAIGLMVSTAFMYGAAAATAWFGLRRHFAREPVAA
jgi:putative peptidoglycan lipid II flippase